MSWLSTLLLATSLVAQQSFQSGNYVIHSWTKSDKLARVVLESAARVRLPGLPADAPTFGKPINIYLAPDDATFVRLTGGQAPEWGAGVAAPDQGVIVLRAYSGTNSSFDQLNKVLRHELAHVALHRYLDPSLIPRWFDEGYAEWSSGQLDGESAWALRVAFAMHHGPLLDSLELSWPSMSVDAQMAYQLAGSTVQYLVNQSGERALTIMLARWRESQSFETALAGTYGLSIDQLEREWRKDVRRRYGWLAVVTQTGVAFTIIGFGVVCLYVIRRRRDRKKMQILRDNELPDEPAYWTEPVDTLYSETHGQTHDDPDDNRSGA